MRMIGMVALALLATPVAAQTAPPPLNAIIAYNPDAATIRKALDAERAAGKVRSPIHGKDILIKDNIETADRMSTTAGSLALKDNVTGRDAPLVARLRKAGALILGKTNMSEWANIRSNRSMSGWSAIGGLVRNPYALDRTACGSSSGSAAAIAAGLAWAAIGTETDGSMADSTGRCNTFDMNVCEQLVEGFGGRFPTQRFARPGVDGVRNGVECIRAVPAQVGAFGKILS